MKLRRENTGANIPPMKKLFPLLLLALAGCAQQKQHTPVTSGFDDQTDWQEDKDFFYRSWVKQPDSTPAEKKEYRDFYYGSWLRNH